MYLCQRQAGICSEKKKNALLETDRGCSIFDPDQSNVSYVDSFWVDNNKNNINK